MMQLEPSWKEKHKYSKQYDMYLERTEDYRLNLGSLYQLIWGQCSSAMKTKLKSLPDFNTINEKRKCIDLLKGIQDVTYQFESKDYLGLGLKRAIVNYYTCYQIKKESNEDFLSRFKSNMAVLAHYGGSIEPFKAMVYREMEEANYKVNRDVNIPGDNEYDSYIRLAKEREAAILFS